MEEHSRAGDIELEFIQFSDTKTLYNPENENEWLCIDFGDNDDRLTGKEEYVP